MASFSGTASLATRTSIKRRDVGLVLYVRRIRIGDGVLLGAGSRLGPGVRIEDGAVLPGRTDVGVGRRIRNSP
jgi:acetyltransferase-like isoleucine patch superfamily enzyme